MISASKRPPSNILRRKKLFDGLESICNDADEDNIDMMMTEGQQRYIRITPRQVKVDELLDEAQYNLKNTDPRSIEIIPLILNDHNKTRLIQNVFKFFSLPLLKDRKEIIFRSLSLKADIYILDNENRENIRVYLSTQCQTPNYLDCEEEFRDDQVYHIRYAIKPESRSDGLYLGINSRYSQPISIKPVYGEIMADKRSVGRRLPMRSSRSVADKTNGKVDVFKRAEARLFDKMTDEERQDEIRTLKRIKQRKIFAMAHGKNFLQINKVKANHFRMTGLKKKYSVLVVLSDHIGRDRSQMQAC